MIETAGGGDRIRTCRPEAALPGEWRSAALEGMNPDTIMSIRPNPQGPSRPLKRRSLTARSHELRGLLARVTAASCLLLAAGPAAAERIPAFPGAEGFGAHSKGGRGGRVLHVTNLNDKGEGSLRWAVGQEGPRTVVFEVSGTIELAGSLSLREPFITIAGQTAPGDGICLRGGTLGIGTHDVVVRYLRCRLGEQGDGGDAISIGRGRNIVVDHCSASWSKDEVLSASTKLPTLTDVTVQWCFITEALNPKDHGYGSLIRGTGGARYSFLHNLYAHNRGRNPRPGNYDSNPHDKDPDGLLLDFRNNVIYNWGGGHAGYNADKESVTRLNYVGNSLVPGPDSRDNGIAYSTGSSHNRAFFDDTMYDGRRITDDWSVVRFDPDWDRETIRRYKQDKPFEAGPVLTESPREAHERVLATGGASLPRRDAVDRRVVGSVREKTGGIIDHPSEVGGWPELKGAKAPADADRDGMPDAWEAAHGLDPADGGDHAADPDEDGYTNLEECLNRTDPREFVDYTKLENNVCRLHESTPNAK